MQSNCGCCPIGSEPALASTYKPKGKVETFGDLPVYTIGKGEKAVIVAYDIYGFDSGRTRLVCDQLADEGFNVIMPDFYRGNPWPEDKPLDDGVMKWGIVYTNDKIQEDLNTYVFPYLEKQGVKSIGMMGFCWGSWVVFSTSATGKIQCGVSCHPSLNIAQLFGGSQEDLTKSVKCPQALFPGSNDNENVKEDGELIKILKEKFGDDKIIVKSFPDSKHGFVTRGDLNVAETARDVKEAMTLSVEYLKKHL